MTSYYRIIVETYLQRAEVWATIWTVAMFLTGLVAGWWYFGSAGMAILSGMVATTAIPLVLLAVWVVVVKLRRVV